MNHASLSLQLLLLLLLCHGATGYANDQSVQQIELLKKFRDEFVLLTPGNGKFPKSFAMGKQTVPEGLGAKTKRIAIDYDFSIGKYEVPQNLWNSVMGANPSRWKGVRNSAEMLSYDDAIEFCKRSTRLMRAAELIASNQEVRLPTEPEWEYSARAGTSTRYSFGDDKRLLDNYAWSTHNAAGNDPPVGAKLPNPWGLYDMHGYLWEWCLDSPTSTAAKSTSNEPTAGQKKVSRRHVSRGGSWKDRAEKLTSSSRFVVPATTVDDAVGLRCVLVEIEKEKRTPHHAKN